MPAVRPILSLASRLTHAGNDFIQKALSEAGHPDIEPCHGDLFAVLFQTDAIGITELARRCGRSKSTLSVMVRRLTALGYLEKVPDPADTRAVIIRLTERGLRLRPVFDWISLGMTVTLSKSLADDELETFERLLGKAISGFEGARN